MRITTVLRNLLGIESLVVESMQIDRSELLVRVRPRWRNPRCGSCGRQAARYGTQPERRWGHLPYGRLLVSLAYAPRRVSCRDCGVRVEQVPWAERTTSRFTFEFEEYVAYLAQVMDKTRVSELTGVAWKTVGSIVERVVARRRDGDPLDGLERIGVDEFSYRKRHNYLTVVVDHDRRRVVWAAEGKDSGTLNAFFEELGEDRRAKIQEVTTDMSAAYVKSIKASLPDATITFDRFHVQKLASDAVDEVRRSIGRELDDAEEAKAIKKSRYALLKNPWDLTRGERRKLSEIQDKNKKLYRAYLLKEMLARALDYVQPARAERTLHEWISWACRSKLQPFVRLSRTIRQHLESIQAYVRSRLTNGFAEGVNNKLRVVARRSYGFHSAHSLIAMLFLTCGGIELDPPLPGFHQHER